MAEYIIQFNMRPFCDVSNETVLAAVRAAHGTLLSGMLDEGMQISDSWQVYKIPDAGLAEELYVGMSENVLAPPRRKRWWQRWLGR